MPSILLIWLAISGLIGGAILGLSGTIGPFLVPTLILLGFSSDVARGTCLLSELLVTAIGAFEHRRAKNMDKYVVLAFFPGAFTAFFGAYLSVNLPKFMMEIFIGIFEILIGVTVLSTIRNKANKQNYEVNKKRVIMKLMIISLFAGFIKGFFGAGWGPIGVGLFVVLGIDPAIVVGSSLIVRLILDFVGGFTYVSMNLFDFEAFVILSLFGCFSVSLATKVTKKLSKKGLSMFLGILIILLGLIVIIDTILLLGI
ncbi:MAG: sulfite exporter TauE/SafE family protein, partial [Candidatus Bathyarchaeia archaeon]